MKTMEIAISNNGAGMNVALAQADSVAEQLELSPKDALRMRLMVEEMMNLMRSIIGQLEGIFWIETTGDAYQLHLRTKTMLDSEQRAQLLSSSTSGKNAAHRGIMGKIRAFFEPMPIDETPAYLLDTTVVTSDVNGDLNWSLEAYKERLRKSEDAEAKEEWDELEKSVISHIADDIQVSIRGYDVELTIYKKL